MPKETDKRNFTVVGSSIGVEGGKYKSTGPMGAAKKAATQQFKKAKNGTAEVKLMIRDTTHDGDHKTFFYVAHRKKLDKPVERIVKFKGVETVIKNEWETTLKKCNAWAHHVED
jgi:hypothetical protein